LVNPKSRCSCPFERWVFNTSIVYKVRLQNKDEIDTWEDVYLDRRTWLRDLMELKRKKKLKR